MRTIITYGTFDLFHIGHLRLLQRLRTLGDRLVVGCSTDEFNKQKGKETVIGYSDRAEILAACRYVDLVFPEENWDQKIDDIKKHNASIFAMGHDWAGKFDFLSAHCEVIYLPRTENISTTSVKTMINFSHQERLNSLIREFEKYLDLLKSLK